MDFERKMSVSSFNEDLFQMENSFKPMLSFISYASINSNGKLCKRSKKCFFNAGNISDIMQPILFDVGVLRHPIDSDTCSELEYFSRNIMQNLK